MLVQRRVRQWWWSNATSNRSWPTCVDVLCRRVVRSVDIWPQAALHLRRKPLTTSFDAKLDATREIRGASGAIGSMPSMSSGMHVEELLHTSALGDEMRIAHERESILYVTWGVKTNNIFLERGTAGGGSARVNNLA